MAFDRGFGNSFQDRAGDDAEGAFRAQEQRLQVIAGVVLPQAPKPVPDAPIGQHHFQPQNEVAGVAVSQHRCAAGIGGQVAADATAPLGAETEGEQEVRIIGCALNVGKNDTGLYGHGVVVAIDSANSVEARCRQDDAAAWDAAAAKSGVAALGHDRQSGLGAEAHHFGHFFRVGRANDGRAMSTKKTAFLDEVRLHVRAGIDPALRADHLPDGLQSCDVDGWE